MYEKEKILAIFFLKLPQKLEIFKLVLQLYVFTQPKLNN